MRHSAKSQSQNYSRIIANIKDDKVRYFYLILGDAIAEQANVPANVGSGANTSAAHIADVESRLNRT